MFNLAIIDDEALARVCIIKLLDMESLGISSYVEAKNAKEALSKFQTYTPDIMLVDIRMPGMDGLTLIKEVKEHINPNVKPIIVSCYEDFNYSREAMQLKAYDYILKPVRKDDLVAAINRAVCELEEEGNQRQEQQRLNDYVIERKLSEFLDKKNANQNDLSEFLSASDTQGLKFQALAIRIFNSSKIESINYDSLRNSIETVFQKKPISFNSLSVIRKADNLFVILMTFKYKLHLHLILEQLISTLKQSGIRASIGIGNPKDSHTGLIESYNESLKASMEFMISGTGSYYYDKSADSKSSDLIEKYGREEKKILDHIRIGSNDYCSCLNELFNPKFYDSFLEWSKYFNIFVASLQKLFFENNLQINLMEDFENNIGNYTSINQILDWIHTRIQELIDLINNQRANPTVKSIDKVIDYINTHYSDELSLEFIASMAHMNSTYFCEIFKKHTGCTFLEYLTKIRIENARNLLTDTSLKIYEIAQKTGYKNPNYFNNVFKKYTGMEPGKYRRTNR
jgi:two-component system response regulator YesN